MTQSHLMKRLMVAVALLSLIPAIAVGQGVRSGSESPAVVAGLAGASVHSAALTYADDVVPVIIQTNGDVDAAAREVTRLGGTVSRQFHLIPALEATVPKGALLQLGASEWVMRVSLNASIATTDGGHQDGTRMTQQGALSGLRLSSPRLWARMTCGLPGMTAAAWASRFSTRV